MSATDGDKASGPRKSRAWALLAMVGSVVVLALASYLSIPVRPVPITLQSLAVCLVGALLGPRLGAGAVVAWLALGAAGAPVLANGAAGLKPFAGATAVICSLFRSQPP